MDRRIPQLPWGEFGIALEKLLRVLGTVNIVASAHEAVALRTEFPLRLLHAVEAQSEPWKVYTYPLPAESQYRELAPSAGLSEPSTGYLGDWT